MDQSLCPRDEHVHRRTGGTVDSRAALRPATGGSANSNAFERDLGRQRDLSLPATRSVAAGGAASAGHGGGGGNAAASAQRPRDCQLAILSMWSPSAFGGGGGSSTSSGNGGAGGSATAYANGQNFGTALAHAQTYAAGGAGGTASGMDSIRDWAATPAPRRSAASAGAVNVFATATGGVSPGTARRWLGRRSRRSDRRLRHHDGDGVLRWRRDSEYSVVRCRTGRQHEHQRKSRGGERGVSQSRASPTDLQSAAYAVGMPIAGDVTAAVVGNPHSTQMVGGGANVLGMMLLGGAYSNSGSGASKTYVSSATFTIDLTQVGSYQDLQLAALDASKTGTGFDSLRLEVIREGVSVIDSTMTDVPSTLGMLSDFVFNLDDIETGILDNMLDVTVRLSLTTDELNAGFRSLFLLANSPLAPFDGDFNNDTLRQRGRLRRVAQRLGHHVYAVRLLRLANPIRTNDTRRRQQLGFAHRRAGAHDFGNAVHWIADDIVSPMCT